MLWLLQWITEVLSASLPETAACWTDAETGRTHTVHTYSFSLCAAKKKREFSVDLATSTSDIIHILMSVSKRLLPELHFEALQNYPLCALRCILYAQIMKVLFQPRIVLSCWHLTVWGKSCSGNASAVSCQASLAANKGNIVLCNGRVTRMSITHHRKLSLC